MEASNVYSRQLFCHRNGYPLYEPDPAAGDDFVRVGDVGHIENGRFYRAFNVFLEAEDPVNRLGVPEGFVTCTERFQDTFRRTPIPTGVICSPRVRAHAQGVQPFSSPIGDGGSFDLACAYGQGAALLIKYPAYREDALARRGLFLYMLKHYIPWLSFFHNVFHRDDIQLSDIILVTGCDLTADWAQSTFLDRSPNISTSTFTVGDTHEDHSAESSSWGSWKSSDNIIHRVGPDTSNPPASLPIESSTNIDEFEHPKFNQCIFIRSYRLQERQHSLSAFPTIASDHREDTVSTNSTSTSIVSSSRPTPNDAIAQESKDHTINNRTRTLHDSVFNYIFQKTNVDIALVHDDDVPVALTSAMFEMEDLNAPQIRRNTDITVEKDERLGITYGRIDTSYKFSPEPELADEDFFQAAGVQELAAQLVNAHINEQLATHVRDTQRPPTSNMNGSSENDEPHDDSAKSTSVSPTSTTTDPSPPTSMDPSHLASSSQTSMSSEVEPRQATSSASPEPIPAHTRAQLHVKVIQARNLNINWPNVRPYAVVQCEQNEFVGGEAGLVKLGGSTQEGVGEREEERIHGQCLDSKASPSETISESTPNGINKCQDCHELRDPVWNIQLSFDVVSEHAYVTFHIYDRATEPEAFLGRVTLKPVFVHKRTTDQWYELQSYGKEDITGDLRVSVTYERFEKKHALSTDDFEFLKLIGRGTYGSVFQARKKDSQRIYAIKVLSIKEIVARKEVAHTIGELKTLRRSQHCPFLVGLTFAFRTNAYLHLVTDFKTGGELFWHLQKDVRLSEDRVRFYVAEIVLALEHLHKYDIVYRDLKPENILLDAIGHIALCDFGLSKPGLKPDQLTNTLCGTTEYLAPEMLLDNDGYSLLVDFWSLGVLLFEMLCGWSPFYAENTQEMYRNICFGKIKFPKGIISDTGKHFVKKLLHRNPQQRLGAQRDTEELKEHPFFERIDWQALLLRQILPPFKPSVESDASVFNFDPQFTSADIHGPQTESISEDWISLSGGSILMTPIGELRKDIGSAVEGEMLG